MISKNGVNVAVSILVTVIVIVLLWIALWKLILEPNPLVRDFFDLDSQKLPSEKRKKRIARRN